MVNPMTPISWALALLSIVHCLTSAALLLRAHGPLQPSSVRVFAVSFALVFRSFDEIIAAANPQLPGTSKVLVLLESVALLEASFWNRWSVFYRAAAVPVAAGALAWEQQLQVHVGLWRSLPMLVGAGFLLQNRWTEGKARGRGLQCAALWGSFLCLMRTVRWDNRVLQRWLIINLFAPMALVNVISMMEREETDASALTDIRIASAFLSLQCAVILYASMARPSVVLVPPVVMKILTGATFAQVALGWFRWTAALEAAICRGIDAYAILLR